MPKRTKSSKRWLKEHFTDDYVKRSKKEGYRSRAAYKLLEIQERDQLIKPESVVLDLGAAPGGWTQVVARFVHGKGKIVALDLLPMKSIAGVEFVQGDFREEGVRAQLRDRLQDRAVTLVLSDMAPNIAGISAVDQARTMLLAEYALELAQAVLAEGGDFLVKVFQGEGFDAYLKTLRGAFKTVKIRKPKASRARSKELYLLARGFLG